MPLADEIEQVRRSVSTDSYQMSISELPDEDDIDVDELINKITSNSEEGEKDDKL